MNSFKKFIILFFVLMYPIVAVASSKVSLDLWKRDFQIYGLCGHCADLITFYDDRDRASFSEYSLRARDGYFTINLKGPKGTAVTLYGLEDFKTDSGYLVIVKEDDKNIEVTDLEAFPPGTWTTVDLERDGNYSVFYLPHKNFKSLINSIQWGNGPQSGAGN